MSVYYPYYSSYKSGSSNIGINSTRFQTGILLQCVGESKLKTGGYSTAIIDQYSLIEESNILIEQSTVQQENLTEEKVDKFDEFDS